eukprot:m.127792 g.127792  ORF g.127792 m.127792 type:complete len:969 (+) comp22258_c1_seq2:82-2988(+)
MQRKGPAQPVRRQPVTMSSSSSAHGGGGHTARRESNRCVEDLAMEDLKDAINQVVLLQNVRGTLMDEIAQLKGTITTQSDELAQAHAATQEASGISEASGSEMRALRDRLVEIDAARVEAENKAGFAEEALSIAASEREALAAQLEAIQCDVEALSKDNGDTAASLTSRDKLLNEQLERINRLEDAVSKQSDEAREAKETEKRLVVEVEKAQATAQNAQTQNDAVRKAEVEILERQQTKLQTENIRLNTELGVATARRSDAELEATRAVGVISELENSVVALREQVEARVEDMISSQQELSALRVELTKLQDADSSDVCPSTPTGSPARSPQSPSRLSRSSLSAPPLSPGGTRSRAKVGSVEGELENERNRANVLEAKLLKREAEAYALGGDRAQIDEKLAAFAAEVDEKSVEINQLRAKVKVTASQRESLEHELKLASAKVLDLTNRIQSTDKALETMRVKASATVGLVASARESEVVVERLQKELDAATSNVERLVQKSADYDNLVSEHTSLEHKCAALQSTLEASRSDAQESSGITAQLKAELATTQAQVADSQRQLLSSEGKRETDMQLLEQKKRHVEDLLVDSRERVEKLEGSLKEARAESDSELQRLKEKMDRLNSDYFETKAEAASLEKQSKETSRQLPLLQEELGDAKLSIGKLTFEVDRLKGEAKSEDAKVEHILKELEEELESEREGRQTLEDESVVIKAQVGNLEQIVQQQQTHGRALVAQLESISGVETRASELEDANTRLVTELHSAKAELNAKASEYTETVEMMRTHAQAENERHEQSYEGLVSMLEALKKELYAHTKKEVEMNHELGKKDNRLDDALKQVATLQTQCESLNENSQILKAAVKEAERELAVAREASDETAEAAQIASALGSDTGLMRQLSEARQEVARVKKEAKDARCASPKMGRPGTVDFKVKLQLSQAQAQAKTLKIENERLMTELEVSQKALAAATIEDDL